MNDICVSICCLVYNHEPYLRDALDGFVMQKTNFKYEVLIHDDASTDRSADIIREYADKYPDIVKPIYQTENQFSKGASVIKINIQRAKGKYIALCEGDDYWNNPYKLQMQVDYMQSHEDCTFCYTNAIIDDLGENKRYLFLNEIESKSYDLSKSKEMEFVPTASFMFPKKCFEQLPNSFYEACPYGDLKLRLFFTGMGYARYLSVPTCVYRKNVPNSAMSKWKKSTKAQNRDRSIKAIKMFDNVDEFTKHKYTKSLEEWKDMHIESIIQNAQSFSTLKKAEYKRVYNNRPFIKKLRIIIKILVSKITHK